MSEYLDKCPANPMYWVTAFENPDLIIGNFLTAYPMKKWRNLEDKTASLVQKKKSVPKVIITLSMSYDKIHKNKKLIGFV